MIINEDTLECDRCHKQRTSKAYGHNHYEKTVMLRTVARMRGWIRVKQSDTWHDYCEDCSGHIINR